MELITTQQFNCYAKGVVHLWAVVSPFQWTAPFVL